MVRLPSKLGGAGQLLQQAAHTAVHVDQCQAAGAVGGEAGSAGQQGHHLQRKHRAVAPCRPAVPCAQHKTNFKARHL
jgi:hypothetical protein